MASSSRKVLYRSMLVLIHFTRGDSLREALCALCIPLPATVRLMLNMKATQRSIPHASDTELRAVLLGIADINPRNFESVFKELSASMSHNELLDKNCKETLERVLLDYKSIAEPKYNSTESQDIEELISIEEREAFQNEAERLAVNITGNFKASRKGLPFRSFDPPGFKLPESRAAASFGAENDACCATQVLEIGSSCSDESDDGRDWNAGLLGPTSDEYEEGDLWQQAREWVKWY
ncbi:hypothetical protein BDV96DRAFT_683010 [Lophiotrema nucula]|uniref:Uncharacterized protein n=1 Tax=Lophiotrema nucula TaxID=690887 RepID=A0A6A5ZNI3_9PLEO|nr:hypothetical protein BDV96DRAFT_683010 [Lophiotrema nucula]